MCSHLIPILAAKKTICVGSRGVRANLNKKSCIFIYICFNFYLSYKKKYIVFPPHSYFGSKKTICAGSREASEPMKIKDFLQNGIFRWELAVDCSTKYQKYKNHKYKSTNTKTNNDVNWLKYSFLDAQTSLAPTHVCLSVRW